MYRVYCLRETSIVGRFGNVRLSKASTLTGSGTHQACDGQSKYRKRRGPESQLHTMDQTESLPLMWLQSPLNLVLLERKRQDGAKRATVLKQRNAPLPEEDCVWQLPCAFLNLVCLTSTFPHLATCLAKAAKHSNAEYMPT